MTILTVLMIGVLFTFAAVIAEIVIEYRRIRRQEEIRREERRRIEELRRRRSDPGARIRTPEARREPWERR